MALDLKRLEAFIAVADSGTYEEAAILLERPQPTVWKQVDQLQADLDGLKLVQGGRPLRLTSAGEQFLPLASGGDGQPEPRTDGCGHTIRGEWCCEDCGLPRAR